MFSSSILLILAGTAWAALAERVGPIAGGPADDEPDILDAPAGAVAAILTGIGTLAGLSVREAVREVIWFAGLIT